MKITEVNKKVIPETYQVRYYFSGYTTPEEMQDVIHSSYGMSYEKLGKDFAKELYDKLYELNVVEEKLEETE
jgi:lysine/ornithine N-monooxygenase